MKGWKTVAFGLGLAVAGPALAYLANIDWTQYVSPTWAPVVAGVLVILLRAVTNTPVGKSQ